VLQVQSASRESFSRGRFGRWLIGLYAWLLALSFGAVLLDVVYANSAARIDGVATGALFNEAADFLQLPLALSAVMGIAALAVAVPIRSARTLLIASLVLTLAPIPALMLFGSLLAEGGVGTGLRLGLGAGASLLAMAAVVESLSREPAAS
jgi:hypothetical protein